MDDLNSRPGAGSGEAPIDYDSSVEIWLTDKEITALLSVIKSSVIPDISALEEHIYYHTIVGSSPVDNEKVIPMTFSYKELKLLLNLIFSYLDTSIGDIGTKIIETITENKNGS